MGTANKAMMYRKKETGFLLEVGTAYRLLAGSRFLPINVIILSLIPVIVIISNAGFFKILGYEFSFVVGIVGAHLAAWNAAFAVRRRFERRKPVGPFIEKENPRRIMLGNFWGGVLFSWTMLRVPLAIICLYDAASRKVVNCDYGQGFAQYLLIPVLSTWLASAIGFFGGTNFNRPYKAYLFFLLIFFLSAAFAFKKMYFGPRVVLNEIFSGMILLPNYSPETKITMGYLLSRVTVIFWTAIAVNLALLSCSPDGRERGLKHLSWSIKHTWRRLPEWQMIWFSAVVLIILGFFKGPLEIDITRGYLNKVLNGELRTQHFIIRYPPFSPIAKDLEIIAESHEFYYHQITDYLKIKDGPIILSYIYPTEKDKVRFTGAGGSIFAKPWDKEIHVLYNPDGEIRMLKHELTHVLAGVYVGGLFKVPLNYAFAEGMAEGVNWMPSGEMTSHQWTAALRRLDAQGSSDRGFVYHIPPSKLYRSNLEFEKGINMANYYAAASFTRFLIDTYGVENFIKVYRSASANGFMTVYGKSLEELTGEWAQYIDSIPLDQGALGLAEYTFSAGPFFNLKCAHVVAGHAMSAREYAQSKFYKQAVREYQALVKYSPEYPYWHYELINNLYLNGEYDEALKTAHNFLEHPKLTPAWEYRTRLRMGDCYAKLGQIDDAAYQYEVAKDKAVTSSQSDSAEMKLQASSNPAVLGYILDGLEETKDASRWYYEKAAEAAPDNFLPYYLAAGSLISSRMHAEALPYIEKALTLDVPIESYLRGLHYYHGICLYRAKRYEEAKSEFQFAIQLENKHLVQIGRDDSVDLEVYRNWIDRCDWRPKWYFAG